MLLKFALPNVKEILEEIISLIISFVITVVSVNFVITSFVAPLTDQLTHGQSSGSFWLILGTFVFAPTFVVLFSMFFVVTKSTADKFFNKKHSKYSQIPRNLIEYSSAMLLALGLSFFTAEAILALAPYLQKFLFGTTSSQGASDPYTPLILYILLILVYFYSVTNFEGRE
jgi:hypothetical protein